MDLDFKAVTEEYVKQLCKDSQTTREEAMQRLNLKLVEVSPEKTR